MGFAQQVQYSSVAEGPSGRAGFQFTCWSEGLSEARLGEIQQHLSYRPPPDFVPTAGCVSPPVSLQFQRLGGAYALIRTAYAGTDYSGREGNYLSHALILDEADAPTDVAPLDLLETADLGEALPVGTKPAALPLTELSAKAASLRRDAPANVPPETMRVFASGVGLTVSHDNIVYVVDDPARAPAWVGLACRLLPPAASWSLTFNTYSADVRLSSGRIRCTGPRQGPEPQRYELESSCTLVDGQAGADGRTTPFGLIVASLIEQDDPEAVDELRERLAEVAVPLTSEDLDAFAIAFDGDPELHQLTTGDQIRALETLVARGGSSFNARHLSWLFDRLPAERADAVVRLHEAASSTPGELGEGVRGLSLRWLLAHPSSIAPGILAGGTAHQGDAQALLDAIEEVDAHELAQCLQRGYSSGLVDSPAMSAGVGARAAARLIDSGDSSNVDAVAAATDRAGLEALTDGLLDAVRAGAAPASMLESTVVSGELVERFASAPDFDTAFELLRLHLASGNPSASVDPAPVVELARSADDVEGLVAELARSGAIDEALATTLLNRCDALSLSAPASLLSAASERLRRGQLPPAPPQVELAQAVVAVDRADRTAKAVRLASVGMPESARSRLSWLRESLDGSSLPPAWATFLRRRAVEEVAAVADSREHARLLDVIRAEGGTAAVAEYADAAVALATSRGAGAGVGACLFTVWRPRRERVIAQEIPRLVGALNRKRRDEIGELLTGAARDAWLARCEEIPTKGLFGRLGRS